ncbi:MAG: DNA-processing protein DprA [marine benthic group bacterium]|nr:DNA-processing protein DprA [Gemmatimonadota bacterium]
MAALTRTPESVLRTSGERVLPSPSLDMESRAAVVLDAVPGLGPRAFLSLIEAHGTATAVLEAARRRDLPGNLSPKLREGLILAAREEPGLRDLALPDGGSVVAYTSPRYPAGLRRLARPPLALFVLGPLDPDQSRTITIVGTRAATEYGRRTAHRLAGELADAGWRVASGIARGIDAAAHRGALEAGGETVGVPGCGFDHVYPAAHRGLYRELARRGLLLSEHRPSVRPARGLFPRRNRILAGLARAVVVVQAGERSGALITVARAQEIDVEVMAVPGPVDLPASRGVNELLRDGAGVATSAADILSMLGEESGTYTGSTRAALPGSGWDADGPEGQLRSLLRSEALHADDIAARTGLGISQTLSLLGRLSLEGRVRAMPGGRYVAAD